MKTKDALILLQTAPMSPIKKAASNKVLTQAQAVKIVRDGLLSKRPEEELNSLYLKRLWQVVKNQKCPKYKKPF